MRWAHGRSAVPVRFVDAVIRRDRRFFITALAYCALAAIVASFQYSVFVSFMRAGAVIPRALGGDFWITASGVASFDFPDPIDEDYAGAVARYAPEAHFRRVVFGFTTWRSPTGQRGNVALVGVDDLPIAPEEFIADRSDLARLGLDSGRPEASIGDFTLTLGKVATDLPTFLGVPYVLVPLDTGRRILRMDPSSVSYLVGTLGNGEKLDGNSLAEAAKMFPEVSLVRSSDFQASSSFYWLAKTGAGLAILLAAALAGLLMAFLLTSGVLRFIQRYHPDLLSLIGHGAVEREIAATIGLFALAVALGTFAATALLTPLLVLLFRFLLPWIGFHLVDLLIPFVALCAAFGVVTLAARRSLRRFAPEMVFRT
jgi:hypothetical protein